MLPLGVVYTLVWWSILSVYPYESIKFCIMNTDESRLFGVTVLLCTRMLRVQLRQAIIPSRALHYECKYSCYSTNF